MLDDSTEALFEYRVAHGSQYKSLGQTIFGLSPAESCLKIGYLAVDGLCLGERQL